MKGLEVKGEVLVKNRKCRRYYGTNCDEYFLRGIHPENKSYISPFTGEKMVSDRTTWLLCKGQDLPASEATHAKYSLSQFFWNWTPKKLSIKLLASEADVDVKDRSDPVSFQYFAA